MHCLYGIPPGGAGTSRHCSSSGQSGSASQATDAAIQPPATTIAASPRTTDTKPILTIASVADGLLSPISPSPVAHRPVPPATATPPTVARARGPGCSPVQLAVSSAIATAIGSTDRETVRDAGSSISSADPRL